MKVERTQRSSASSRYNPYSSSRDYDNRPSPVKPRQVPTTLDAKVVGNKIVVTDDKGNRSSRPLNSDIQRTASAFSTSQRPDNKKDHLYDGDIRIKKVEPKQQPNISNQLNGVPNGSVNYEALKGQWDKFRAAPVA